MLVFVLGADELAGDVGGEAGAKVCATRVKRIATARRMAETACCISLFYG